LRGTAQLPYQKECEKRIKQEKRRTGGDKNRPTEKFNTKIVVEVTRQQTEKATRAPLCTPVSEIDKVSKSKTDNNCERTKERNE
jgi:hypothetical protein